MQNKTNLLLTKGIILRSGEICQDKINLISGAMTTPFMETIWTFTNHDTEAMERIFTTFCHLYEKGHETEMVDVLRILYDLLGLKFSEDIELVAKHPQALHYFMLSFLIDFDDIMTERMFEEMYSKNKILW